jgi:hypothetical protein
MPAQLAIKAMRNARPIGLLVESDAVFKTFLPWGVAV